MNMNSSNFQQTLKLGVVPYQISLFPSKNKPHLIPKAFSHSIIPKEEPTKLSIPIPRMFKNKRKKKFTKQSNTLEEDSTDCNHFLNRIRCNSKINTSLKNSEPLFSSLTHIKTTKEEQLPIESDQTKAGDLNSKFNRKIFSKENLLHNRDNSNKVPPGGIQSLNQGLNGKRLIESYNHLRNKANSFALARDKTIDHQKSQLMRLHQPQMRKKSIVLSIQGSQSKSIDFTQLIRKERELTEEFYFNKKKQMLQSYEQQRKHLPLISKQKSLTIDKLKEMNNNTVVNNRNKLKRKIQLESSISHKRILSLKKRMISIIDNSIEDLESKFEQIAING